MAPRKKPAQASTPATPPIDPNAVYECKMAKVARLGAGRLRPSDGRVRLRGAHLQSVIDSVASYEKVGETKGK